MGGAHVDPERRWISDVGDPHSYGNLWFDHFARTAPQDGPPAHVVTGQLAALFGIYDYWRLTGDRDAARLFDGGASTLVARLEDVRVPGHVARVDAETNLRRLPHHRLMIAQLEALTRMTGRTIFLTHAAELADDVS
jgi:hypothetical protein